MVREFITCSLNNVTNVIMKNIGSFQKSELVKFKAMLESCLIIVNGEIANDR